MWVWADDSFSDKFLRACHIGEKEPLGVPLLAIFANFPRALECDSSREDLQTEIDNVNFPSPDTYHYWLVITSP